MLGNIDLSLKYFSGPINRLFVSAERQRIRSVDCHAYRSGVDNHLKSTEYIVKIIIHMCSCFGSNKKPLTVSVSVHSMSVFQSAGFREWKWKCAFVMGCKTFHKKGLATIIVRLFLKQRRPLADKCINDKQLIGRGRGKKTFHVSTSPWREYWRFVGHLILFLGGEKVLK